jgi:hypothetical protein
LATFVHFYLIYNSGSIHLSSLLMGTGCGYLSVFVTTTAEHFGTNLRVLASATITNFMRGAVTVMVPFHLFLQHNIGYTLTESLMVTGIIIWALALTATWYMPDTYGKDLDYLEEA